MHANFVTVYATLFVLHLAKRAQFMNNSNSAFFCQINHHLYIATHWGICLQGKLANMSIAYVVSALGGKVTAAEIILATTLRNGLQLPHKEGGLSPPLHSGHGTQTHILTK